MSTVFTSDLRSVQRFRQGKVRDIYAVDDEHLLIVATDRLSAFDIVLPTPIPDKGQILTAMSNFWFARTAALVPNHLTTRRLEEVLTPWPSAQKKERSCPSRARSESSSGVSGPLVRVESRSGAVV